MMADLLSAVVAGARRSAEERERIVPRRAFDTAVASRPPQGDLFRTRLAGPGINVIAECKRRSPSRGVLREEYDPVAIARGYEKAGAAAISVLTEPTFFDGSLDHLERVRQHVRIPLLRKDFIVCDYQLHEAAARGADAALLIVSALDHVQLRALMRTARSLGLAVLTEVHDREELTRAVDAGADIIGVNSRNLRTLTVDPMVLAEVGGAIPREAIGVAESGLKHASDIARFRTIGYRGFLIGERFMTDADPGAALGALIGQAAVEARP
jgi:indole-3-glycerol phosphate synthase